MDLFLVAYAGAALIYLVPTAVAIVRRHYNVVAIFTLNVLLGWSFVGWAVALVWAVKREVPVHVRVVKHEAPGHVRLAAFRGSIVSVLVMLILTAFFAAAYVDNPVWAYPAIAALCLTAAFVHLRMTVDIMSGGFRHTPPFGRTRFVPWQQVDDIVLRPNFIEVQAVSGARRIYWDADKLRDVWQSMCDARSAFCGSSEEKKGMHAVM